MGIINLLTTKNNKVRTLFILLIAIHCFGTIKAQDTPTVQRSPIIERIEGKEYYIHLVRQGQTLEAIANTYNTNIEDINLENPRLKGIVREGDVIKIPVKTGGSQQQPPAATPTTGQTPQAKPKGSGNTHIVAAGETFFGIARKYNISVTELQEANPGIITLHPGHILIIPGIDARRQTSRPAADHNHGILQEPVPSTYLVEPGATLFSISRKFNIPVDELRKLNPELNNGLKAGQVIRLRPADTAPGTQYVTVQDTIVSFMYHRVKRGETVYSIARRFGIRVADIMKYNPQAAQGIQHRQVLQIPVFTVSEKKIAGEPEIVPQTAEYETPDEPSLPLGCIEKPATDQIYNIALLVPFFLDSQDAMMNFDTLRTMMSNPNRPFEFMQFYYGALLAIDSLGKSGLKARVSVFDVDNTPETVTKLLARPEMAQMDLIIGPLYATSFEKVARFARNNGIKIINPLSTRNDFLQNNPYSFKAQSSAGSQIDILARYIASTRKNANVIVVRQFSFSEAEAIETFRNELGVGNLHEVIYIRDSLNGIVRHLRKDRENIVVGLSNDKVFAIDLIRKLNDIRLDYPITCFGLQAWEDFGLDTDYMVNLRLHLPAFSFIDFHSEPTRNFIRSFRSKFNTEPLPNRFAFAAFDVTYYFLSALMKYGKDFEECLPYYRHRGVQIPFNFEPSGQSGMENKGMVIYKIQDFWQIEVYPVSR